MTWLEYNDRIMIAGSTYFPASAGKYRGQQIKADLQTAVELDHPEHHDVRECHICLAREWDMPASAARIINDLRKGFCSTLLEILGAEGHPSPGEEAKFREIQGLDRPQDAPREEGAQG